MADEQADRSPRLPFRWMLISDRSRMGADPVRTALDRLKLIEAGEEGRVDRTGPRPFWPPALQWREKEQSPREQHRDLKELQCRLEGQPGMSSPPAPLIINDRIDLALALGIHVHLTEMSLPTRVARDLLPPNQLVGRSVHSFEGALEAEREGADYVLFGPIFDTPSKRGFGKPQGIDSLAYLSQTLRIPVVAVGGIGPTNVKEVLSAGASAWAAISAAWDGPWDADAT